MRKSVFAGLAATLLAAPLACTGSEVKSKGKPAAAPAEPGGEADATALRFGEWTAESTAAFLARCLRAPTERGGFTAAEARDYCICAGQLLASDTFPTELTGSAHGVPPCAVANWIRSNPARFASL